MYAKVIVEISSTDIDRIFEYKIGDEWLEMCKKGTRVIVPFGWGNKKIEGYVLDVSPNCEYDINKLKNIYEVLENGEIIFNENMINLAYFISKKYFCTLSKSLQSIMPTGIKTKSTWYIKLNNKNYIVNDEVNQMLVSNMYSQTTKTYYPLMDYLQKYSDGFETNQSNGVSIPDVQKVFGKKIISQIDTLVQKQIILKYQKIQRNNMKKEIVYYKLNENSTNFEKTKTRAFSNDRFIKQQEVFNLFEERNIYPYSYLKDKGITTSVLNTLVKNDILICEKLEERRKVFNVNEYQETKYFQPNQEQQQVLDFINNQLDTTKYEKPEKPILLHGITGSGKTEIYLQTINKVIQMGKQAIVLVPEISLTPQMMDNFISRFGDLVTVTHSKLNNSERYDQWKNARDGEVSIIIGPRSALFTPFNNLGVIIIDEVHENTYSSDTTPKYDGREVAIELSEKTGALLIMGSATPNVDFYYRGLSGEFNILTMEKRAGGGEMPEIKLVDMRNELEEGNRSAFSRELQIAIRKNLENKEQTMLFLNRRGYSTFVSCRSCGFVMECTECQLPYTYHQNSNMLICHHCGQEAQTPKICPECESRYIKFFGMGTQKIEEEARRLFPQANILRMDFDTTKGKLGFKHILDEFRSGKGDILIGTQMIAKGHDFPKVTLMGIMAADTSLYTSSFYGAENTFQLITQGAGRAGRAKAGGLVYLQTYQPKHYAIICGRKQDYHSFYKEEITYRKTMDYPPFGVFFSIVLLSENDEEVAYVSSRLYAIMSNDEKSMNNGGNILVMNAVATTQRKIDGKYGYRILIQGKDEESLVDLVLNYIKIVKEDIKENNNKVIKKHIKSEIYFNLNLNPYHIV